MMKSSIGKKTADADIRFHHDNVEYGIGLIDAPGYVYFSAGTNDLSNPVYRDRRKLKRALNKFTKALRKQRMNERARQ
jgi:hypothetical protein